jgi:hypothetical protein
VDNALAAQLITVGATLGGVVLTLVANALLDRRRANDAYRLESLRLTADHSKWLRDERMKAYAAFSLAGEEVLQFLRTDLPVLLTDRTRHDATSARWRELRTDLRKAYNQVLLLGAEEPKTIGLREWRLARDSGNDLIRDVTEGDVTPDDLAARIKEIGSRLGTEGDNFLKACRADLQNPPPTP